MSHPSKLAQRADPARGRRFRGRRFHIVREGKAGGANNHLLVSICHAFGVPVDTFGEHAMPPSRRGRWLRSRAEGPRL